MAITLHHKCPTHTFFQVSSAPRCTDSIHISWCRTKRLAKNRAKALAAITNHSIYIARNNDVLCIIKPDNQPISQRVVA
jgi:hypothetical protein